MGIDLDRSRNAPSIPGGGGAFPNAPGGFARLRFPGAARRAAIAVLFLIAYVVLERLSFLHEYKGLPVTPWNPGLGMMFALIALAGAPAGGLLFAGVIVSEILVLRSGLAWPIILGIGAIVAASYTAAAGWARTRLKLDVGLAHLRDVLALLAAGFLGALVVAALLMLLLIAAGELAAADALSAAAPLLIGDALGIAVMAPLLLRFAVRWPDLGSTRWSALAPEIILYAILIGGSLWLIVGGRGGDGFKLFYLIFLPVVAAAVRHGLDGACLSLAATQFGLVGLLLFYGYDARAFTDFQTLMLALTATGLIVGVVVSERENADRLMRAAEARLREREAEAAQAARASLVSSMASALAHEINQPMTAARALGRSAQHILQAPGGDLARANGNLTSMIAQIDHAGEIVRRMRDFLRRGRPHVSTIDVASMLADALALVRAQGVANNIRIDLDVAEDTPVIHGDRVQLQQVVLNLIANAMEAISGAGLASGHIRVAARLAESGAHLEILVTDTGPGIDSDIAGRLFKPLMTSKQQGLGLGLAICVSIVEAHGGRIQLADASPGHTEFRVSLPLEQMRAT